LPIVLGKGEGHEHHPRGFHRRRRRRGVRFHQPASRKPAPIVPGSVKVTVYDGVADDLLSAGLNLAGLMGGAPAFADPANPTAAELRRNAIYNNYRGIVDPVAAGGMGLLWGPGSPGSPVFEAPVTPGLIPGVEYRAYLRVDRRRPHVNSMPAAVQIPSHFDPAKPCIVAAMPREDALVFPNLHSRAYYALNQLQEGTKSRLSYIEVTPGQHFDAFISAFFGGQFAPLHYYFVLAMDGMYAHLTSGTPLPPSQVVRPTPRGTEAYDATNVADLLPPPVLEPEGDRITFSNGVLSIPE